MNREDIIRMAKECGYWSGQTIEMNDVGIERFAALVASAERNRTWTQDHWTEYERAIVAQEREACAITADKHMKECEGKNFGVGRAIRARGQA